jgi:ATP-dependent DNA ligase
VRLFTRNGQDWSDHYPRIVESALKNRQKHFVLDGEAVVLGFEGIPDSMPCTLDSTMRRCNSKSSTF